MSEVETQKTTLRTKGAKSAPKAPSVEQPKTEPQNQPRRGSLSTVNGIQILSY